MPGQANLMLARVLIEDLYDAAAMDRRAHLVDGGSGSGRPARIRRAVAAVTALLAAPGLAVAVIAALLTLLGLITLMPLQTASAQGLGPAGLQEAGWDCILPPREFNPNVHCFPPGQLAGVVSGEAILVMTMTFATSDLGAIRATLLGTERMIRADRFHDQPCPTDPPSYKYSWLYPRFGWDYYICHTFDSPW